MSKPAISVSNLVKSYKGEQKAVDGISFEVRPGQVFGLLGPNGAGKTTTVKMILGLVLPTDGTVDLAGFDVSTARNKALSHVGAVLEGSRNIYWRLSARANLEYFGALRGMRGKKLRERMEEVLDLVDLIDRADEETRYLSRGMQQKVALAAAMLHGPDILLLDEPTLGLDVQSSRIIEQTIQKLVTDEGKAVLLTTHQMALAERLCHQILVINQGKKVAGGSTRSIIQQFGGDHQTVEIQLETIVDENMLLRIRETFPSLAMDGKNDHTTLIWANHTSQQEMIRLLNYLDTNGLPIYQVVRREATLEEVFVQLTSEGKLQ